MTADSHTPVPMLGTRPEGPGRFRRALGAGSVALALAVIWSGAAVVGTVAHLRLPAGRGVLRSVANLILGNQFKGKLLVGEIDRLDLHGLSIRSAVAIDPRGVQAARIDGLRVDADVLGIVRGLAFAKGDPTVSFSRVHVDQADLLLEEGPTGDPTIAETFKPRRPPSPPSPGEKPFRLRYDRLEIGRGVVHGHLAPTAPLDAEFADARGTMVFGPDDAIIDVASIQLEVRAPGPKPTRGLGSLHVENHGEQVQLRSTFDGALGDVKFRASFERDGDHIATHVDVPVTPPEVLASLAPDPAKVTLRVPVAATFDVDGDLPNLAAHARVVLPNGGFIALNGRLGRGPALRAHTAFEIHEVNPQDIAPVPPSTPFSATGHAQLELSGEPRVAFEVRTAPFRMAGEDVPAVDGHAVFDGGVLHGALTVHEPGLSNQVKFSFSQADGLAFSADIDAASLRQVSRIAARVDGAAKVRIAGTLVRDELATEVSGQFSGLRAGGNASAGSGGFRADIHGPLRALELDGSIWGSGVVAAGRTWQRVTVQAKGPVHTPHMVSMLDSGSGEVIRASAALDLDRSAARSVTVDIRQPGAELHGTIARIAAARGGVAVEGVSFGGGAVGKVAGDLFVRDGELVGKLHGEEVDLRKVSMLLGSTTELGGLANVDIDITSSGRGTRRGHINVEFADAQVSVARGLSGVVSASFAGDGVWADGLVRWVARSDSHGAGEEACDGAIAQLRVSHGDGRLRGPLLEAKSWAGITGKVDLSADDWNLRCLAKQFPIGFFLSDLRGMVTTRTRLERSSEAGLPSVPALFVRTRGLEIAGPQSFGNDTPDWESRHVDLDLKGSYDAHTGGSSVTVALRDATPIVEASAATKIDLPSLLRDPRRAWAALQSVAVQGSLDIPRRPVSGFASLPSPIARRLPPMAGDLAFHAKVEGTFGSPQIHAHADGKDLALLQAPLPVSFTADASYDAKAAQASAHILRSGNEVARIDGDASAPWAKLLAGALKPTASVRGTLIDVPLGDIPFFSDRDVAGLVGGSFAWQGIGSPKPSLRADLTISGLRNGDSVAIDRGSVHIDVGEPSGGSDSSAKLAAHAELVARDGGRLTLKASSGVRYSDEALPVLDGSQRARLDLKAERFRLAVFAPLTSGVVSRLDGMLDGDLHVGVARPGESQDGKVKVAMKLTDGIFNLPAVGQEFHNATLSLEGGKDGVININDLAADGLRGRLTGAGHARFAGLRFVGGDVKLTIAEGAELPITVEGVPFGDARGEVVVTATDRADLLDLHVAIPKLHIELPAAVGRGVQELHDNPAITVVDPRGANPTQREKNSQRVQVSFDLGQITVKAKMLNVELGGVRQAPLRVDVTDRTKVTGDIKLAHGKFVIAKKEFQIDSGVIHMRAEDASNPSIILTARWDSPEGPIYIDYNGLLNPITPEKMRFRSPSPSLATEQQIMNMLITGGADQSTGSAGNGQPLSTVGQAAGRVLLDQLGTEVGGGWSTTLQMSDASTVQAGLKYQTDNAAIGVTTYDSSGVTQSPTPGVAAPNSSLAGASVTSADATAKGTHNVITIDWRMFRSWLLRGHVDVGSDQTNSGLDVLWQRRY